MAEMATFFRARARHSMPPGRNRHAHVCETGKAFIRRSTASPLRTRFLHRPGGRLFRANKHQSSSFPPPSPPLLPVFPTLTPLIWEAGVAGVPHDHTITQIALSLLSLSFACACAHAFFLQCGSFDSQRCTSSALLRYSIFAARFRAATGGRKSGTIGCADLGSSRCDF